MASLILSILLIGQVLPADSVLDAGLWTTPENILVSIEGEVKISDFGISKTSSEPSLTQAGVIKGKLSYLSPEQALGQMVDHQADIYSLGIVFYEIFI